MTRARAIIPAPQPTIDLVRVAGVLGALAFLAVWSGALTVALTWGLG